MIRLFKVKQQQLADPTAHTRKVQTVGKLRVHKDISELNLSKTCCIAFPNGKEDLMYFEVTILPDEGYYAGGSFKFSFQISDSYPYEPPKVKCMKKVYHPNMH
ncbi:hypothetical protein Droror1_Dr00025599 [Drosera rotundifolia]